jgi:hypothetical protein
MDMYRYGIELSLMIHNKQPFDSKKIPNSLRNILQPVKDLVNFRADISIEFKYNVFC